MSLDAWRIYRWIIRLDAFPQTMDLKFMVYGMSCALYITACVQVSSLAPNALLHAFQLLGFLRSPPMHCCMHFNCWGFCCLLWAALLNVIKLQFCCLLWAALLIVIKLQFAESLLAPNAAWGAAHVLSSFLSLLFMSVCATCLGDRSPGLLRATSCCGAHQLYPAVVWWVRPWRAHWLESTLVQCVFVQLAVWWTDLALQCAVFCDGSCVLVPFWWLADCPSAKLWVLFASSRTLLATVLHRRCIVLRLSSQCTMIVHL